MNGNVCVYLPPVEKREKRIAKPRELTPFDGMEVATHSIYFDLNIVLHVCITLFS